VEFFGLYVVGRVLDIHKASDCENHEHESELVRNKGVVGGRTNVWSIKQWVYFLKKVLLADRSVPARVCENSSGNKARGRSHPSTECIVDLAQIMGFGRFRKIPKKFSQSDIFDLERMGTWHEREGSAPRQDLG